MKTTDDIIRGTDLICFSNLRWTTDYQRPQDFMSRFSTILRVFYIEEPVFKSSQHDYSVEEVSSDIFVITPILPEALAKEEIPINQQLVIEKVFYDHKIKKYWNWYYYATAFAFTSHLRPELTIYDCIDQKISVSANPDWEELENQLLKKADVIVNNMNQFVSKEFSFDCGTQEHIEKQLYKSIWEETWHKIYGKIYGIIYDKYMHSVQIEMYTSKYERYSHKLL